MAAGRFLQLTDVAEILNISSSQTYALVRSGELPAIKIGGHAPRQAPHRQAPPGRPLRTAATAARGTSLT
jgi:excisionase family DNA binding protein